MYLMRRELAKRKFSSPIASVDAAATGLEQLEKQQILQVMCASLSFSLHNMKTGASGSTSSPCSGIRRCRNRWSTPDSSYRLSLTASLSLGRPISGIPHANRARGFLILHALFVVSSKVNHKVMKVKMSYIRREET